MAKSKIEYPYIPSNKVFLYVPGTSQFMAAARKYAKENSLDNQMPTGSVIVKNDKIIAYGANGSDYHDRFGCERVKQNIPTGQRYDLCEGCHPKNHAEPRAIANALEKISKEELANADLYLWGHWWACEDCWNIMIKSDIGKVYLIEDSELLFNKNSDHNIVGKQFE